MDFWVQAMNLYDYLQDWNLAAVLVRVFLAAFAGGLIGIERGFHGRAAGLRTHMLVALGASLCALIGCYLSAQMAEFGVVSDAQRTGAQVMSGVGFLGAGTILLKRGNDSRITGLTTAAGLWATAAVGLAVGYGLYLSALLTVVIIVFAFTLLSKIEFFMNRKRQRLFVYIEIDSVASVKSIVSFLSEELSAVEIQVTPPRSGTNPHVGIEALIRIPPKSNVSKKIDKLQQHEHIIFALPIG